MIRSRWKCARAHILPVVAALTFAPALHAEGLQRVSLNEAIRRALARNVTAQTARLEITKAQALVEQARATSFPTLVGTGTYTRLEGDRNVATRLAYAANSLNANLTLTVPLIVPKPWVTWSHAGDQVDVVDAQWKDTRRTVAAAVAHAYLAVIVQKRVLEIRERARDTAQAHYEFAHKRFAGGLGNRIDEVRAQQELESDNAQVEAAKTALVRAYEALGILTGDGVPLDVTGEPNFVPPASEGQVARDVEHRPDVEALRQQRDAAHRVSRDSWTEYSPYLIGTFQPFYQTPQIDPIPQTGWQAQLVLTLPIYDGGLRYGLSKERRAVEDESEVALQEQLREARSEVRVAFESMRLADSALEASRHASDLAQQALELAELSYRAGASTNIEVIDAERTARDAETDAAVSEDTARQARLDLLVASGRFP